MTRKQRVVAITESVVSLNIVVTAGFTGKKTVTTPLKLRKNMAIRNTATNATTHYATTNMTVLAGRHRLIDALPDHQAFSTAPHADPEHAPKVGEAGELTAFVDVAVAPVADTTYTFTITYWEIEYEDIEDGAK